MDKRNANVWSPERIAAELLLKRQRIGRVTGRTYTQVDAADMIGISIASYKLAEKHGVVRGKVRSLIVTYLTSGDASAIKYLKRKTKPITHEETHHAKR